MSTTPRLPPGFRLVMLDTVDSTNHEARRRAEAGAAHGTIVRAVRQTAGRARRGRSWTSPPGNLYMTLIVRLDCTAGEAAGFSFVTALALADTLAGLVPPMVAVGLKWPNDVLVNHRKISGILLESSARPDGGLDWMGIGVGVNVESFPDDTETPATSLHFEGAGDVTADDVMLGFARHFLKWSDAWTRDGFEPIRTAWLARAIGVGEAVRVRLGDESFSGTFVDLDPNGALIVARDDGSRRTVAAGDVFPAALSADPA